MSLSDTASWWLQNWRQMMLNPVTGAPLESFKFWMPLVRLPVQAFALLGNEEGECSFRPGVIGVDHGQAHGAFQWHSGRAADILKGCGIDVAKASHLDQLRAAHWEMTHGVYRHVWPALLETTSIWDGVTELVRNFEQSGFPARDIPRRASYGKLWQEKLAGVKP